jgi:hypothetical protein
MARPPTAPVNPNRCRRERPGCVDIVYPLSDKRWRDTTRRRSPLGVPVLVAEEGQAGLEAASSTWCGRQYSPFRAGSQTAAAPSVSRRHTPRIAVWQCPQDSADPYHRWTRRAAPPRFSCMFHQRCPGWSGRQALCYGHVCMLSAQPRVRQVQVSTPLRWSVLWYALFSDTSRLPR